jgi:predicted metalloprotease with PDZ domain
MFLHADRPLISGNGTSTLLHELVHVAQAHRAARDEDWIVEGIAEFYTLELMQRSGTISTGRRDRGFRKLEEWAERIKSLEGKRSTGARTAKGVTVMRALDAELRVRSKGRYSLDDVARALAEDGAPVSTERLRRTSAVLAGGPLEVLSDKKLAEY